MYTPGSRVITRAASDSDPGIRPETFSSDRYCCQLVLDTIKVPVSSCRLRLGSAIASRSPFRSREGPMARMAIRLGASPRMVMPAMTAFSPAPPHALVETFVRLAPGPRVEGPDPKSSRSTTQASSLDGMLSRPARCMRSPQRRSYYLLLNRQLSHWSSTLFRQPE